MKLFLGGTVSIQYTFLKTSGLSWNIINDYSLNPETFFALQNKSWKTLRWHRKNWNSESSDIILNKILQGAHFLKDHLLQLHFNVSHGQALSTLLCHRLSPLIGPTQKTSSLISVLSTPAYLISIFREG